MAKARVSSRRPKSALDRDRYTAELSTGQLVIGVCILLMFGLGCFLLGVLIGKFDPTLRDRTAATQPQDTGPQALPPAPQQEPTRPVDTALPPEIRAPRTLDPPAAGDPGSSSPATQTGADSGTTTEPPASNEASPPAAGGATSTASTTPPPVQQPPAAETPAPEPERAAETPPPPAAVPAAVPAATQAATPDPKGLYGVQVIAVARPRAEAVKRDIEARSAYKTQIIPIDGDRLCKVVVGSFPDERSALRARDEMRRTYQFRDAFVVPLK